MKKLTALLLGSLIVFFSQFAFADNKSLDAVVIMDSSGSMKKTDPRSLRKPAAKLFISLLNEDDRVSIMSFSDNGYPITYLNSLDNEKNRQLSLNATDKISTKGIHTNIHAAIERAYKILAESPSEREPVIILLSDGKMDIGDSEKSQELSIQLIQNTMPKLIDSKIKVYSIAFTENSDRELLTALSEGTEGFCKTATNDKDLHSAFTSIFEQSKQPDMLPLTENSFLADESIREITIVANKADAESKILLEDPNGIRLDASIKNQNIKWFISDTFDMITIKKPLKGEWKILFSDNDNKAYIVADMSMKSKFDFVTENKIKKLHAQAWLEKEESIVTEPNILDSIDAHIELSLPSEETTTTPMGLAINEENLSGIFVSNYIAKEAGTYFATITLKSQTFERQKTFSFRSESTQDTAIKPEEPLAEEKTEATTDNAKEPDPKEQTDMEPVEEDNFIQSLLIFLGINIIVIIIGLSGYLVFKLKKQKQSEE